jgi:hypothetical protein
MMRDILGAILALLVMHLVAGLVVLLVFRGL